MSFLNENIADVGPSVARVAVQQKNDAIIAFQQIVNTYENGLRNFWQHPRFLPQEISDELGANASEMFRLHGLLTRTIMEANPTQVLTDVASLGTFTINQDGTVTAARN